MNRELERDIAKYLAELPQKDRDEAFTRINGRVDSQLPIDEVEAAIRAPIMPLGEYLDLEMEMPPFLVSSGQVVAGEITALIARAGKGKTTLVRNRMIRWAAGLPLFPDLKNSQIPERPLKILLIEAEGVGWDMKKKLGRLLDEAGLDPEHREEARKNLTIWGDGGYSDLKIDNDEDYALICRGVEETSPDVVVMEPFRGLWRGEENDATAMEGVLDRMVAMASRHQCAIMLSHHERKSGAGEDGEWMSAARGSGVLEGKCAVMENFRAVKDGHLRELSWSKSRYFPTQGPVRMEYDEDSYRYNMVAENEIAQEAKALLTQDSSWFTVAEISEELNDTQTKVGAALKDLLDSGVIVRKKHEQGYRYRLKPEDDSTNDENGGLSLS